MVFQKGLIATADSFHILITISMSKKRLFSVRHWWLMPVILATQETEIRKIAVQSQPGQ
jgi:hypothetical protein